MRRLLVLSCLMALSGAGAAAAADCKEEVAAALDKQRKSSSFRMQTMMLSVDGPLNMTVDYVLPDRMRQVVSLVIDPKPVETILIGERAWSNNGKGWQPIDTATTSTLIEQLQATVGEKRPDIQSFECAGKATVDGRELTSYLGENDGAPAPEGDKPKPPSSEPKAADRPVRIFYVDPTTGLPARSIFARANKLEQPIARTIYTYPVDIKIDPPAETGK